jgi:hypothetical protein
MAETANVERLTARDREHEEEFSRKIQEAKQELGRISAKRRAVEHELDGRAGELKTAFGILCATLQSRLQNEPGFGIGALRDMLTGFLEVYGLVGGQISSSQDEGKFGVRFSYTPEGSQEPILSVDYTFQVPQQ